MVDATQFEITDGIARITLDRPEARNSLNFPLVTELIEHIETVRSDDSVCAVTIRGAGETFSAGADLTVFHEAVQSGDRETVNDLIGKFHEATRGLEELDVPVLAAVEGYALAGGIELLLATDIRIATESAIIGDQHANVGLVAGAGGTQRLQRQVPTAVANDLMYTGRQLSGTEASNLGLVSRAVPETMFEEALAEMEASLAEKSAHGQGLTKRLMREGGAVDLEHGLQLERHAVIEYYFSEDATEGFTSFVEGRALEF